MERFGGSLVVPHCLFVVWDSTSSTRSRSQIINENATNQEPFSELTSTPWTAKPEDTVCANNIPIYSTLLVLATTVRTFLWLQYPEPMIYIYLNRGVVPQNQLSELIAKNFLLNLYLKSKSYLAKLVLTLG